MKKIIIIASIVLIFIIIFLLILRKKAINTSPISPFPTSISSQESNQQNNRPLPSKSGGLTETENINQNLSYLPIDISTITPIETEDFKLQYSSKLNKIVVEKKTPQAEEQFINWAYQNQLTQLIENPELTLIVEQGKNPDDFNPLLEFLNIFMNFGQGVGNSTGNQQSTINNQELPSSTLQPQSQSSTLNPPSSNFTYFAQCNGYGNLSLPSGCNLCRAGCGPTTVAMIAASYLGSNYNPKTIVDIYKSNGYLLGCAGSRYSDAKQVFQSLGLKTTDFLIFNGEKADTVVPELKKYLSAGWTFFTLANFRVDGGGHFFWITDIDNQNNIWAYDPYYGRYKIPYNENSRYPYPLYRVAFGVKK
ncbi:C39 family peptidase [Candidatus Roizmanbacteria bacterium]|nr:C39 family peptidase [Candidatus Roizmanbacteria bacterium]